MRAMVRGEASLPNSGEFGYGAGGAFYVAEVARLWRRCEKTPIDQTLRGETPKLWRVRLRRGRDRLRNCGAELISLRSELCVA